MAEEITLKELFDDIIEKKGAYNHDHLQHAENVMEKASKNAKIIKEKLITTLRSIERQGDNCEGADCASAARYLLKNLGEIVTEE